MKQTLKYLFLLLTFYLCHIKVYAQQSKKDALVEVPTTVDSLLSLLKTAKQDTNKVKILYQLSDESMDDKNVLYYAEESLRLAEKLSASPNEAIAKVGKKGIANASNNIGYVNNNLGDIPKALQWYHKALKIQEEIDDKSGITLSLNNIAVIYKKLGDIPKALDWNHKALKIQEEIDDKEGIATSLNAIAVIYNNQDQISKSLEWSCKALKIQEEIGDNEGIALSKNNIASIYFRMGSRSSVASTKAELYNKALEWNQKAIQIQKEIGDKSGIAISLSNMAIIYDKRGDIAGALERYHKALEIQEEIGDKGGIAYSLNHIGHIYLKQKNYKLAEDYSKRSLKIAKELGFPELLRSSGLTLSEVYKQQGKYKDAFEMYVLFKQMADSINNVETRKSGLKKQMQYEFEKKESATKAEQDKKDAVAEEEKQRQKVITYSVSAGLILVLLLALFILRGYKQKQKANTIITQQKLEVENKNQLIEEKNKDILDSIKYARRIQASLLPTEKYIDRILKDKDKNTGKG